MKRVLSRIFAVLLASALVTGTGGIAALADDGEVFVHLSGCPEAGAGGDSE